MAVRAEHDEVRIAFLHMLQQRVKRAAFGDLGADVREIRLQLDHQFVQLGPGAAHRFFLIDVHGGKFLRRETVGRVAGFGLHGVEQAQLRAKGFGHPRGHFEHSGCGV